jgi:multidrug efflux pump subunit AcrA (membrane-fusion protein)
MRPVTNRRIGERYPVELPELTWDPVRRDRRMFRRKKPMVAWVAELSLTGAGVVVADASLLATGEIVRISVAGAHGTVEVRRSQVLANDHVRYGVRFVTLDNQLHQIVLDNVAAYRPSPTYDWEVAPPARFCG